VSTETNPFRKLERTIAARAKKPNPKSYTSQLLSGGVEKIGAKIVEEAAEVVEAAGEAGQAGAEHFIREVGDLVYHLIVMMSHKGATLADVEAELARRFGVSGIEEKSSRRPASRTVSDEELTAPVRLTKAAAKKAPVKSSTKTAVKPAPKIVVPAVKKKAKRKSRM
jgi:phosphoribosyl-ATP pyrophosphohydrolase